LETQTASSPTDERWDIMVIVAARWRFSSTSGAPRADVQFQQASAILLSLAYGAARGWSIAPAAPPAGAIKYQLTNTFCETGEDILAQLVKTGAALSIGLSYDRGARGCELVLDVNAVDEGLYLWRFGVLLAADTRAQAAHPELPVAPPEEIAAVEQP
jgi:hypothetical protein